MSNVKPIFSFLPHFLENIVVILCTGRYGPCLDLFYCQQQRSDKCIALRNFQKKEPVGLRSGDLKGHSLMSFAILSRNGEQDLCSVLQLLHNLKSICEEMKIVSNDLPKIFFFKNITSPNSRHLRTARKYCRSSTRFSLTGQSELFSVTDPATLHKTMPAKNIWLSCCVLPIC
jgi:hypothetical protein